MKTKKKDYELKNWFVITIGIEHYLYAKIDWKNDFLKPFNIQLPLYFQ